MRERERENVEERERENRASIEKEKKTRPTIFGLLCFFSPSLSSLLFFTFPRLGDDAAREDDHGEGVN